MLLCNIFYVQHLFFPFFLLFKKAFPFSPFVTVKKKAPANIWLLFVKGSDTCCIYFRMKCLCKQRQSVNGCFFFFSTQITVIETLKSLLLLTIHNFQHHVMTLPARLLSQLVKNISVLKFMVLFLQKRQKKGTVRYSKGKPEL